MLSGVAIGLLVTYQEGDVGTETNITRKRTTGLRLAEDRALIC